MRGFFRFCFFKQRLVEMKKLLMKLCTCLCVQHKNSSTKKLFWSGEASSHSRCVELRLEKKLEDLAMTLSQVTFNGASLVG